MSDDKLNSTLSKLGDQYTVTPTSPHRGKDKDQLREAFYALVDQGVSTHATTKAIGIPSEMGSEWVQQRKRDNEVTWTDNEETRVAERQSTIRRMWRLMRRLLDLADRQAPHATFRELMGGVAILAEKAQLLAGEPTQRTSVAVSVVADQLESRMKRASVYLAQDAQYEVLDKEVESDDVVMTSHRDG